MAGVTIDADILSRPKKMTKAEFNSLSPEVLLSCVFGFQLCSVWETAKE